MKLPFKLTILSTLLLLFSCQEPKPADVPPVTMVFDHNHVNQEVKMEVTIEEADEWRVTLRYSLEKPKKFNIWIFPTKVSDKKMQESLEQANILGITYSDGDLGVPAKYKVKVYDHRTKKYLVNEIIANPKTYSGYDGRYSDLVSVKLDSGKYTIYVTYLEGAHALNQLYAKLVFLETYKGK